MIYANAETAQDIASLLRIKDSEEILAARKVADRLLGKTTIKGEGKGIIITAPRQSGKTTELLKYAEEENPNGQFIIVCHNFERQKQIIRRHWEIFNRISQADIVARKLLGEPMGGIDINPPLMVVPGNFHFLCGNNRPIYVDELCAISNEDTMKYVLETGRFVAAVTS